MTCIVCEMELARQHPQLDEEDRVPLCDDCSAMLLCGGFLCGLSDVLHTRTYYRLRRQSPRYLDR